jgi:hypothetical protein
LTFLAEAAEDLDGDVDAVRALAVVDKDDPVAAFATIDNDGSAFALASVTVVVTDDVAASEYASAATTAADVDVDGSIACDTEIMGVREGGMNSRGTISTAPDFFF